MSGGKQLDTENNDVQNWGASVLQPRPQVVACNKASVDVKDF